MGQMLKTKKLPRLMPAKPQPVRQFVLKLHCLSIVPAMDGLVIGLVLNTVMEEKLRQNITRVGMRTDRYGVLKLPIIG